MEELYKKVGAESFLVGTDLRLVEQAKVVGGRSYEIPGLQMRRATVFPTGTRETLKISLQNGVELSVTPEHRLFTDSGWKEAQNLSAEDSVYLQSGEGGFAAEDDIGEDWVREQLEELGVKAVRAAEKKRFQLRCIQLHVRLL
ncbi:hypothetical protein ACFTAO_15050 [Paenibacillus rhizoplanae]